MQKSVGAVKRGFSIPHDDFVWIDRYLDESKFHSNISDFVPAAICKVTDLIYSTRLVDALDHTNLLRFLQMNFYDTIDYSKPMEKIQVRFTPGQDKILTSVCLDCKQYRHEITMFDTNEQDALRRYVMMSIRFYISYRHALDGTTELPSGYIISFSAKENVLNHVDLNLMCYGRKMNEKSYGPSTSQNL